MRNYLDLTVISPCHFFSEDSDDDLDEIGKMGFSVDINFISIIQICLEEFQRLSRLSIEPSWLDLVHTVTPCSLNFLKKIIKFLSLFWLPSNILCDQML